MNPLVQTPFSIIVQRSVGTAFARFSQILAQIPSYRPRVTRSGAQNRPTSKRATPK